MTRSKIMSKDELLAGIKSQLPQLATQKQARGWNIVLETWDDDTIMKAMGRSKKLPGAIWAIEEQLKPLVAMRNEALAAGDIDEEIALQEAEMVADQMAEAAY